MRDVSYQLPFQRVKAGQEQENLANKILGNLGWTVRKASSKEDRIDKIDCYLNDEPAQIKSRATGDDLIVEVYRPYVGMNTPGTKLGRDFKGKFTRYVIVGRNNELPKVYDKEEIFNTIIGIMERWSAANYVTKDGRSKTYRDDLTGSMICIKEDNYDHVTKLLVYIPQNVLKELHPNEDQQLQSEGEILPTEDQRQV